MKLKNPQFKHIKNIIFDFGNVLLDIDISLTIKAFEQLGLNDFSHADIHPHNAGVFLDVELGRISNQEFIDTLKSYATSKAPSDIEIYYAWNMLLLQYDFQRFELLDKLRQNYGVFLLSNTNLPHREFFIQKFNAENPANRPFESYFDKCFYSDEMHLRKPDTKIYTETLKDANLNADDTLFIDDNAHNLIGAQKVGLSTYHLESPETILDLFE